MAIPGASADGGVLGRVNPQAHALLAKQALPDLFRYYQHRWKSNRALFNYGPE